MDLLSKLTKKMISCRLAFLYALAPAIAFLVPVSSQSVITKQDPIVAGLASWRKPGKIAKAPCVSCHGPDGLELAIYDFSDADIRRRAIPHLSGSEADEIVRFIHAIRRKYHVQALKDPMRDRPFQPGEKFLSGNSVAERDLRFGQELESLLPTLMGAPIPNLEVARRAQNELLSVDPRHLSIGIPLNRFSEDVYHGREHASLAHWLPDVPIVFSGKLKKDWFGLQDGYLQDPSDENLWKLIRFYSSAADDPISTGVRRMAFDKYRSLLFFQHGERSKLLGKVSRPAPIAWGKYPARLIPNPMWQVGDTARFFQEQSPTGFGLDPGLLKKKQSGPSFERQMLDLQASWFWVGWLNDQGLERTSRNVLASRGDWLALALWNSGPYPIHVTYAIARKQAVVNEVPDAWGWNLGRKKPEWDYLAMRIGSRYITDLPTEPKQRRLYTRFTANCFRMSLFLIFDEWARTKTVWYRSASQFHLRALTEFIDKFDAKEKGEGLKLRELGEKILSTCEEKT
jgi:cytochrome c553